MPNNDNESTQTSEIEEIDKYYRQERRVLARLLDELQWKANHHLVFQVNMGEVESYLTSVTLNWVVDKVGFIRDFPVFRKSGGESGDVESSKESLEQRQQRDPDWTRQRDMAAYLAARRHHKFPPLLLVGYQGWVFEDRHERWGEDGRAMSDSLNLGNLDTNGMCWELDDSSTQFYALDGQHRLMAIRGLKELIQTGPIAREG